MLGVAIGEIISLIYLSITYFIRRKKEETILEPETTKNFWEDFKFLIKKSFPITLNSIILPLIIAIDSFLIINLLMRVGLDKVSQHKCLEFIQEWLILLSIFQQ